MSVVNADVETESGISVKTEHQCPNQPELSRQHIASDLWSCSDRNPALSDHGQQDPCRSLCGSHGDQGERGVHTAVLQGAVSDAHLLRRDEAEPEIHRCDRARSQVCQVVHQEVCREPKASSPGVHLLHQPLCGTNGADSGRNHHGISKEPSHDQHAEAQDQGRSQAVSGAGGYLQLERGRTGPILERGGRSVSAGRTPEQHGVHHVPDRQSAPDLDPDDPCAADCQSVREGQPESEFRSWVADEIGCHVLQHDPSSVHDTAYFQEVDITGYIRRCGRISIRNMLISRLKASDNTGSNPNVIYWKCTVPVTAS